MNDHPTIDPRNSASEEEHAFEEAILDETEDFERWHPDWPPRVIEADESEDAEMLIEGDEYDAVPEADDDPVPPQASVIGVAGLTAVLAGDVGTTADPEDEDTAEPKADAPDSAPEQPEAEEAVILEPDEGAVIRHEPEQLYIRVPHNTLATSPRAAAGFAGALLVTGTLIVAAAGAIGIAAGVSAGLAALMVALNFGVILVGVGLMYVLMRRIFMQTDPARQQEVVRTLELARRAVSDNAETMQSALRENQRIVADALEENRRAVESAVTTNQHQVRAAVDGILAEAEQAFKRMEHDTVQARIQLSEDTLHSLQMEEERILNMEDDFNRRLNELRASIDAARKRLDAEKALLQELDGTASTADSEDPLNVHK